MEALTQPGYQIAGFDTAVDFWDRFHNDDPNTDERLAVSPVEAIMRTLTAGGYTPEDARIVSDAANKYVCDLRWGKEQ